MKKPRNSALTPNLNAIGNMAATQSPNMGGGPPMPMKTNMKKKPMLKFMK